MKKIKISQEQNEALEKVEGGAVLVATLVAVLVSVSHAAVSLTEVEAESDSNESNS